MSNERALLSRRPSATNTRRHPVERGNRARYRARPTAPSAEALDQVGDSTKDVTGGKTMATYVLVHGSNQGGWIWQPVANLRRAAGHQVYAPSLDGCGERKSQMRPGITAETQANEVAQLMFYEDLKDVMLVGTSYGGRPCCTDRSLATRGGRYRRTAPFLTPDSHRAIQSEPRSPSSHPEAAAQSDELGRL